MALERRVGYNLCLLVTPHSYRGTGCDNPNRLLIAAYDKPAQRTHNS